MNSILEFQYRGLRKVISGGQCGVDYGGVSAASTFGLETGGMMPYGFRTHHGNRPDMAEFGMVEHISRDYPPRTEANVLGSDGTLIIASDFNSPGVTLTRNLCVKHGRPYYEQNIRDLKINSVINWMITNSVEVVNVAGNRDKKLGDTFHEDRTYAIMMNIFFTLRDLNLIKLKHIYKTNI